MGAMRWIVLLLTRPLEFRTLLQFYLYYEQKRDIQAIKEHPTSGWDRASMRKCWEFLDMTSRSFAAVIKELEGDLARTICLFYLVLRGLDTIEDDMTIPDEVKQPILRKFHEYTVTPGWTFNGNGLDEKDRQLLVEYNVVVEEVNRLVPEYRDIIVNIAQKMETGMADYCHKAATTGSIYLDAVAEYDLYCHYVAGLVGEGLSRLFSASGKEQPWIAEQLELSNSVGLLLQKTNIIRDYREDVNQGRCFWPREIWGKKEYGFTEMKDMYEPQNATNAQWVQSAMIADAMRHTIDALDYLKMLKNQSVFNFVAIPATMAIATLELCFMNPAMFQRNIKIRKAVAAKLIMRSTNPREVALVFQEYTRRIHAKAVFTDPNFVQISIACGKIEQWCEHQFPSFVQIDQGPDGTPSIRYDPADLRTKIVKEQETFEARLSVKKLASAGRKPVGTVAGGDDFKTSELLMYMTAGVTSVAAICFVVLWAVLKYTGEPSAFW